MKIRIRIFLYLVGSLFLLSCGEENGQETSFEELQINRSDQFLILPAGVIENKVTTYEEGFTQHFIFKDSSYVIILQGGNAELAVPNNSESDKLSRKERIDGFQLVYGNVTSKRKLEFDQAFDRLKENGIQRK